ncbi:hypothetical protein AQUCO_00300754v1 [Aquilegia coerulea]|uniref:AIG1-type G domain-containing protein n=1 Tax=Aquilegia coerulea TaxID=218851 RepID=A0A2G5F0D4_AQUCA|nr:hypothetical protein AQUCO_00300754v1 [Aquilegia coerulea]
MDSNQSVSLSPTQTTPQDHVITGNSNSNSTIPIRAPLSFDSDFESAIKTHSRSSSISSSVKSFVSEEEEDGGFVSGDDGFETASERHEENLEVAVMEGDDVIVPIVPKSSLGLGLGSPSFSTIPPKARVTGDDDDEEEEEDEEVVDSEGVDEGVPTVVRVPMVDAPKVEVLEVVKGEEGGDSVVAVNGSEEIKDDNLVENGLISENPVLGLGSVEVVEEKVPDGDEVFDEALAVSKEHALPENPDSGSFVRAPGNGVLDSEGKGGLSEESPVIDSGSPEVVVDSVSGGVNVSNEALVVGKEDVSPESPKLDVVVNPEIGSREKEEVETKNEVVDEEEVVETTNEHVDEKTDEGLGDERAISLNSSIEANTGIGTEQHDVVDSNGVSDTQGVESLKEEVANVIDSKLVEEDKQVKSLSEEDLIETKPISLEPESVGVCDVQENQASETKPVEVEAEQSVNVGVVSDQSPAIIEKPDESKAAEFLTDVSKVDGDNDKISAVEKNLEPVEDSAVETQETDHHESVTGLEVRNDDDDDEKIGTSEKPELERETISDVGTKPNEPAFRLVISEDDDVSGDEAHSADSVVKSGEVTTVQEDIVEDLSSKSSGDGVASQGDELKNVVSDSQSPKIAVQSSVFDEVKEAEVDVDRFSDYDEAEGSVSDEDNDELNFGSTGTAEQIMKELMRGSGVSFRSGEESSQDNSQRIDGQILMDSDDEVDTDEEGEGKELFDSAALAALLKAATGAGSDGGNVTITSQDGSRLFSVERPAGLGSSLRSKPASQPSRPNIFTSSELMASGETENMLTEEEKNKLEKIQLVRVKFLRLIHRLGHTPDDSIAAQVLYRMVLAAGRQTGPSFSLETAKKTAMQLEAEKKDDLDFSLNILVLGKTGVGKSATINSIFGEAKAKIGAFEPATTAVKEIIGTVGGVKIRVIDTPGLKSSVMEQSFNRKVLSSVKKMIKKSPLDILLYVDRLDTQTRDLNDLPLLKTITSTLGSSIWRSAVVTLTHAASAPPDGPSGSPLSYEVFVAQRSHIVQQSIGQAVGDLRMMNPSLMNPVSLVENHPSCRKNREGERILPNGQIWRPQLMMLCYSLKILSEVSTLSKPQDPFDHRKLFGFRVRAPPLPYLLSSLLQSRAHPKLSDDQGGENVDSDIDLEDLSDSDQEEEEDEYDQLPPFKPLRKSQIAKLSKDQKKAYFDEYDYRVKLLQKKQWKEELKRMKEMKTKGKDQTDNVDYMGEDAEQEGPAAVPVPLPDMVLPPSFDGDNPAYRYRFLEPTSQLLARPVLDSHGWDHDCGYDGVSLEENLAIAGKFPAGVAVQITKDKKEFNIHLDSSVAAKHGENGSTLAGFDIQTIGKQLGYIIRGETKFKNFKKNRTTGGVSVTFLGENVATGLKVEDQICIGKRLTLVGSTGAIRSQGDVAYGANLEARLKEKDFPIGQDQSTLGLSLMKWRGDLALGANLQSQVSIGRSSKMSIRVGLNNKLSGQITVRTSSSEQLQLALVGILPIAISIYRSIWPSAGESFSPY